MGLPGYREYPGAPPLTIFIGPPTPVPHKGIANKWWAKKRLLKMFQKWWAPIYYFPISKNNQYTPTQEFYRLPILNTASNINKVLKTSF